MTLDLLKEEYETKWVNTKAKAWMQEHSQVKDKAERATVEQDCEVEGCDSTLQYFYSLQLRSVDEGQTVYYECTKCGNKV